jgi:hypothetical protein
MSTENKSQKQMILEYMQSGGRINKYLAFQLFGCMTLAQRIDDIEDDIETGVIKNWELLRDRIKEHKNASEYWMQQVVKGRGRSAESMGQRAKSMEHRAKSIDCETINMFESAECINAD